MLLWKDVGHSYASIHRLLLPNPIIHCQQRLLLGLTRVIVREDEGEGAEDVGEVVTGEAHMLRRVKGAVADLQGLGIPITFVSVANYLNINPQKLCFYSAAMKYIQRHSS